MGRHNKFTVLLLVPDYATKDYGRETYLAHVSAKYASTALEKARADAVEAYKESGVEIDAPDDFYPLLTVRGHADDFTWEGRHGVE